MLRRTICNLPLLILAGAAIAIGRGEAACLVGDIMYSAGDSIGHIGLECVNETSYEGTGSTCGPSGTILEESQSFRCPDSVPYCVQCGPRGWGNALCLSTATTDRDCGGGSAEENNPIVCPDGRESIAGTFCGRGQDRADCGEGEYCFIDPTDRFAVCCLDAGENPGTASSPDVKCCDPMDGPGGCPDASGSFDRCWDEGGYCCSDGQWYADDGAGGNNCQDNGLEDSKACEVEIPTSGANRDGVSAFLSDRGNSIPLFVQATYILIMFAAANAL